MMQRSITVRVCDFREGSNIPFTGTTVTIPPGQHTVADAIRVAELSVWSGTSRSATQE